MHRRKDGTEFPVEISSAYFRYGDKEYCNGFAWNITERKRTEEALRESEERFRTLFDNSPIAIGIGRDTKNLYANHTYLKMFGFESLDEVIGQPIADHWSPEWRTLIEERSRQRSQGLAVPSEYEATARRKDGRQFPAQIVASTMDFADGRATVAFITDLTERKQSDQEKGRLERQLQQAQKMESVGRLAGGVAHDFNNMLGVILGNAEIALAQVDEAHTLHENLSEILKAGRRSADLTRQLLAFARKQTVAPKVLDLNETIAGMLKMLERMIGENILLNWQPAANLWPVRMDPSQIDPDPGQFVRQRAGCHLRCRQHHHRDGKLHSRRKLLRRAPGQRARRVRAAARRRQRLRHGQANPRPYLRAILHDQAGRPGNRPRSCHRLRRRQAEQRVHQCRQRAGDGNDHHDLSAPAQGRKRVAARGESSPGRARPGDILLVEDEPAILKMTAEILQRQGHRVLAAATAAEAIRLATEHPDEIHLLITDVIMPDLNGRSLAQKLMSLHPRLKCLFMSGYTADVIAHQGVLEPGTQFLQKPFSIRELVSIVQKTLDIQQGP